MDIVLLLGTFAKHLNQGRAPAAKQEGAFTKLLYGPTLAHWIRIQRIGGRRVRVQMPARLSGLMKNVSLTHRGGLVECIVRDREGFRFPEPPEPKPEPHQDIPPPQLPPPAPQPTTQEPKPEPVQPPTPDETPEEKPPIVDDLDDMTHAELDERAEMLGVEFEEVGGKLLKAHKIAQIRAFLAE